jgi:hypothetical protein
MKVIRDVHSFLEEKRLKIGSNWAIIPHTVVHAVSGMDL